MNIRIREKLEVHDYSYFYITPSSFDYAILTRLFILLKDPDKAKRIIFHWVWVDEDVSKKFKAEIISLLESIGYIVDKMGGKWFRNLWELENFVEGLHGKSRVSP